MHINEDGWMFDQRWENKSHYKTGKIRFGLSEECIEQIKKK